MLAPVGGSKTQSTSTTSPTSTTTSSTGTTSTGTASTKKSSGIDAYITRSSGEEIPQTCSVGGVSNFSLTSADFSAQ